MSGEMSHDEVKWSKSVRTQRVVSVRFLLNIILSQVFSRLLENLMQSLSAWCIVRCVWMKITLRGRYLGLQPWNF